MAFIERRRFPRLNSRIPIQYERIVGHKSTLRGTITGDIGGGGIKFIAQEFIPLFIKLKVKMFLTSSSNVILALSKVIWVRKLSCLDRYEVGLEFVDLPQINRRRITNYIGNRSRDFRFSN